MSVDRYQGHGVPPSGDLTERFPYLADEDLREVVNMAIYLGRPLLVKGPPGCGKSRLAHAIAHELGQAGSGGQRPPVSRSWRSSTRRTMSSRTSRIHSIPSIPRWHGSSVSPVLQRRSQHLVDVSLGRG